MMTSRSEYRLILREDNADLRLTEMGYEIGLISEERYNRLQEKKRLIEEETARVEKVSIAPTPELNKVLEEAGTAPLATGCRLAELLKRPQLSYKRLAPFDKRRPELPREVFEQVEINLKYAGYIKRQLAQVAELKRLEVKKIPENIDYDKITNLRLEAIEKLKKIKPETIGQASRISGVSPADIAVLLIYLR
jgi:tRNA uridine 5-carboxymethylaminomethyl modification enzyme